MRLLQLHNLFPLNIYDIARFGCSEMIASEPVPASAAFAAGQGPGLWRRRFGTRDLPEAVEGSEAMRVYQLGVLTRSDGIEQLVGLGVRIGDLFADDLPLPQRWALKVPNPLMVFYSLDGEEWEEYSLGEIEKHDGDYPLAEYYDRREQTLKEEDFLWNRPASVQNALMNSTGQWRRGTNTQGDNCLWCCTGTHLLEWDGYDARLTPLDSRATALALSNGRFYLSSGSRSNITASEGVLAYSNVSSNTRSAPKATDERVTIIGPGATNLITFKDKPNDVPHELHLVSYVGGQWLVLLAREWANRVRRGQTTKQEIASFYLPSLPTEPLEIATRNLEYVELSEAQEYFDLGRYANPLNEPGKPPDPIVARRCSGRAYIFQRLDFQDQGSTLQLPDMERETMPVLEMLCNPSLSDFDLTAAISQGEGHLLGTADGYILAARIAQNTLTALARLDGAVLSLHEHSGRFYALTVGALWYSANGTSWEVLREVLEGYEWRDVLITASERMFVLCSEADAGNGANSKVVIYDLTVTTPLQTMVGNHDADLRCMVEYSGRVLVFGAGGEDGEYVRYNALNESEIVAEALLENETVVAAAVLDDFLIVGTQSGKLLMLSEGAWSLVATTEYSIAGFTVINGCLWIRYDDGSGFYSSWSEGETEVTHHEITAPCATDVRVFLTTNEATGGGSGEEGGGSGSGGGCSTCEITILTDAGPSFGNCVSEDEALWFSEPRGGLEYPDVFDAALAAPLASSGSIQRARAFVGPAAAGDDLSLYQPLKAGVRTRLLRPLSELRFAVVHEVSETHTQYEFAAYRRNYDE